jgi:hypothetical protein
MWATEKEYLTSPSAGQFSSPLPFGRAPMCSCARHRRFLAKPVRRNLKMGQVRVGRDRFPQVEESRATPGTRGGHGGRHPCE